MELTGEEMIISYEDLWSIVGEYIDHLRSINQTAKLQDLINLMHRHKEYQGRELEPVINLMSKYGMPHEFPAEDESPFNETASSARCPPSVTTSFEVNLIQNTEYW
jgi:hypothetical protein